MRFWKYQALGNDYLVIHPVDLTQDLTPKQIRRLCDRHYGVGADGLLIGPYDQVEMAFRLRLFNPDGGEFEKSGNGLRIFSRYLWDLGLVQSQPFTILTPGGKVTSSVYPGGQCVTVEMGNISFDSRQIPVAGPPREVLNETLDVPGHTFRYCAASIGNPHCVILDEHISEPMARKWGPLIEQDSRFPHRTNVQFMQVRDRQNIAIEIWERGAGYTLASGSSSSAAAAVAYKLGLCDSEITVHAPGGQIEIGISPDFAITMTGTVAKIAEGALSAELFADLSPSHYSSDEDSSNQ